MVDKFLSKKLAESGSLSGAADEEINHRQPLETISSQSPVKTIIHEIKPQTPVSANGGKPAAVDFVSENEVRDAINKGEKIYISAKTIVTPSARDLGEERDIFATV